MVVMLDLDHLESEDLVNLKHHELLKEVVRDTGTSSDSSLSSSNSSTSNSSTTLSIKPSHASRDDDTARERSDIDLDVVHGGNDHSHGKGQGAHCEEREDAGIEGRLTGFAAALACYPIVTSLASLLDLNSLHSLSRTCRQFRATLLLYRNQLVSQSLRCSNDEEETLDKTNGNQNMGEVLAIRFRESHARWRLGGPNGSSRLTSGKVGLCARDLVAECRKCGLVVCRNCTAKPPPGPALAGRHRRLCHTCINAPLSLHLSPHPLPTPRTSPHTSPARLARIPTPTKSSGSDEDEEDVDHDDNNHEELSRPMFGANSISSTASCHRSFDYFKEEHQYHDQHQDASEPLTSHNSTNPPSSFTSSAFLRQPCSCDDFFWLCPTCGHNVRTADTTYARGWTWRTKYSHLGGGLGTGLSEGNKGVECGRKGSCIAVRLVEQEVEVDAEVLRGLEAEAEKVAAQGTGRRWTGSSFVAQEIEGVGGMVKMKVRRLVKVGAEVDEFEEEDEGVRSLGREVKREVRSWCAWCQRVIPSKDDGWEG